MRWVQPGRAVAEGVAEAIAELQGSRPLEEVMVVVPPGSTASTLRRLLPRVAGGVAGIRFLTPIDLAVELVDASVSTRRAVTTQLQLAAVSSVLAAPDCPDVLRDVREHAATIEALVDMATSLRAAHVDPRALDAVRGQPGSVRAALVDVVVRARQLLLDLDVRDESATLSAVAEVSDTSLASLRLVVVATDTFHPAQLDFVGRLAAQPMARVVAVIPDERDRSLHDQLEVLGCGQPPSGAIGRSPRVVSCPDADEEVRYAVRYCAGLIDQGRPAEDIAIVCAAAAYRRSVRDELQRAGIAWTGGAVERVSGSVAGQVLRALLDGAVDGWDRPAVFRLLAVAPLYPLGEFGAQRRIGQWTSLCRRLNLVSADDWRRATDALAQDVAARRSRWPSHRQSAPPTARERADQEALDRLLALVTRLQGQTKRLHAAPSWTAAARVVGTMLEDHIGVSTWRERAWSAGPAWQRNAADHVERLVAGLAELDHDGVTVTFATAAMRRIVSTLLDTPVRRRGDAAGAVTIADMPGALCLDAHHVVVVGANEGVLPASVPDDLLLGRDLPAAAAGVVEAPRARVQRAERAWSALLRSDAEVLVTWARADLRRGGESHPSPLLVGLPMEHHRSHEAGVLTGSALTVAEELARESDPALRSPRTARRANALVARLDPAPTEFDGVVGPHPALAPDGHLWSITSIEDHARCGLSYFAREVLDVREEVDAATIVAIEPPERGVLVHKVFEHLANEWLATDPVQRPPWLQGTHLSEMHERAAAVLDQLAGVLGVQHRLGHPTAWVAERAHLLRNICAALDGEAAEGSTPLACEHTFTGVQVGDARFTGQVDRIDVMPDGGLRVTDFKTSAPSSVKADLDEGRRLQLPLYARAADHDAGELLPGVDRSGAPPATARYLVVRDGKAVPKPLALSADLIAEFEAHVGRWLGEIAAGQFTPRPHPLNGRCVICCNDSLGIEELAERARVFAAAPQEDGAERPILATDRMSRGDDADSAHVAAGPIGLPDWVRDNPQQSLAVSAGAGSGKTTSLVGRVAALLGTDGVTIDQLVVITFTEKAAREVSHRLRQEIGRQTPLDEAYIGTIHGFCTSLLRRYPIEAGLPPKFTTADELTSGAQADARAKRIVQQLYDVATKKPAVREALMVIASCGALSALPDLVRSIDNDWLRFEECGAPATLSLRIAQKTVVEMLESVNQQPEYLAAKAGVRGRIDAGVAAARAQFEAVGTLAEMANAGERLEEQYHGTSPAWGAFRAALRFARFEPAVSQLMSALVPLVVDGARRRVANGELSFDDLLLLTRRLLQRNERVRAEIRARHRYLFVDEFQDTDQVQFDIITELTEPEDGATLFAVGDPKQSIYGFRNADVSLFAGVLAKAGDQTRQLTINRRTRADVCAWINAVLQARFARFDEDAGGDLQVDYLPLEPQRPANPAGRGPAVVLLGVPDWGKIEHASADDCARAEAADVAALIQEAVEGQAPWWVEDPVTHRDRPARHGDVTILVRSRTRLGVLEHTLRQAGVPYRVEGGTLIYGSREVYELLRVLRAVDDPTNGVKVVNALRTSIFAISDRALLDFRAGDGTQTLDRPRDFAVFTSEVGPVGDALRVIGELARRRHERTPAELLAELYDGWRGAAAALFEGQQVARETWRRVRYVLDEARAWSDATGGTLSEYLAWVDRRIEEVERVEVATDEGEDSVRIMTIHAAKGLEFPITVIAGLGSADATNAQTGVRWNGAQPLVRLGRVTSAELPELSTVERKRDRAEEARLLYVAFTRAKDHLVVSMHHKGGSCPAGRLLPAVLAAADSGLATCMPPRLPVWRPPSHDRAALLARLAAPDPAAEPPEIDRALGQHRRIWTPSGIAKALGDAHGPTIDVTLVQGSLFDSDEPDDEVVAPGERFGHAVSHDGPDTDDREATDPGNRKEPVANDRPSRRGGRFGTAKGSAVHAVMQQVVLHDPRRGLPVLVNVAAEAEGVLDRRDDVEQMVESLLRGAQFQAMQTSPQCRREMYVGADFGGMTVWGYVDAVYVAADGTLTLVDFKTDTLVTSTTELARRYQPQMSAYVAALEQATGMRVGAAWLSVAQADGSPAVDIPVDVVPIGELLASLSQPSAAA